MVKGKCLNPSKIITRPKHCEIIICDRSKKEKARALIDIEDKDKINKFRWSLDDRGYVCSYYSDDNGGHYIRLHRFIMGKKGKLVIDHINRNKLDNRRCNLRFVCESINHLNSDNKRGVYKYRHNCWQVYIKKNHKTIYLGSFRTYKEALDKRIEAEFKIHGFVFQKAA